MRQLMSIITITTLAAVLGLGATVSCQDQAADECGELPENAPCPSGLVPFVMAEAEGDGWSILGEGEGGEFAGGGMVGITKRSDGGACTYACVPQFTCAGDGAGFCISPAGYLCCGHGVKACDTEISGDSGQWGVQMEWACYGPGEADREDDGVDDGADTTANNPSPLPGDVNVPPPTTSGGGTGGGGADDGDTGSSTAVLDGGTTVE